MKLLTRDELVRKHKMLKVDEKTHQEIRKARAQKLLRDIRRMGRH